MFHYSTSIRTYFLLIFIEEQCNVKNAILVNSVCFILISNKRLLYLSEKRKICEKLNYTLADLPFTGIQEFFALNSFYYLHNHPEEKFVFYYGKIYFGFISLEELFHAKMSNISE